jgi:hypothetical protein
MDGSDRDVMKISYYDSNHHNNINNRNLMTGTKTVLVIRATAADRATTASESALSDDIFGTLGDTFNLKSQYYQCSDGKLQFQPLTTNTLVGSDGVYTVNISSTLVSGASDATIRDAMVRAAVEDLGSSLQNIADFVMLCLPPGTAGIWIAYAFVNHWLSVFNDDKCQKLKIQLHEVGTYVTASQMKNGCVFFFKLTTVMMYFIRT